MTIYRNHAVIHYATNVGQTSEITDLCRAIGSTSLLQSCTYPVLLRALYTIRWILHAFLEIAQRRRAAARTTEHLLPSAQHTKVFTAHTLKWHYLLLSLRAAIISAERRLHVPLIGTTCSRHMDIKPYAWDVLFFRSFGGEGEKKACQKLRLAIRSKCSCGKIKWL